MITGNVKPGYFAGPAPRIMAHRGASGSCPENTMVSFAQAVKDGADVLEMDVQMSRDGKVVVTHDANVFRTTNGAGLVRSFNYADLKKLDAGFRFSPDKGKSFPFRGKGVYMPLFEEVLEAFPDTPINVEIKDPDARLAAKMAGILHSYGRIDDGTVLVAAETGSIMRTYRKYAPTGVTGHCRGESYKFVASVWLGLDSMFSNPCGWALQIPATRLGVQIPSKTVIERAHKLGVEVHVWTINDPRQMKSLIELGVDGIFTDHPAIMRSVLDSLGRQVSSFGRVGV